jgi:hypothetical protein
MSKWFSANKLALNLHKTNMTKFVMKNLPQHTLSIGYKEKYVEKSGNTKFLGLKIDKTPKLEKSNDQLVLTWCMVCS